MLLISIILGITVCVDKKAPYRNINYGVSIVRIMVRYAYGIGTLMVLRNYGAECGQSIQTYATALV